MTAASGIFLLVWRRDIRVRTVILSLSVTLLAYLAGLQLVYIGVISKSWNIIFTAFTLPMFIAGGLLYERTRLGGAASAWAVWGGLEKPVLWVSLIRPTGIDQRLWRLTNHDNLSQ
jgi:hypothetical protein